MRRLTRGLLIAAALSLLPAVAAAAEPTTTIVKYETPTFPTPYQSAILGLALTAVVAVGARATQRTPGAMMYMVLATVALTGVFIAASHKIHTNFNQTATRLQQTAAR